MTAPRSLLGSAARAATLALMLLAGCGEEAPPALDPADLRFVREIEAAMARGQRPDVFTVQELKRLGGAHSDDPAIGALLLQLLPALRDWDGLARWLEAKRGSEAGLDDAEQLALAKVYLNLADYDAAWKTVAPLAEREPDELEANAYAGRTAFLRGDAAASARHYGRVWTELCAAERVEDMSYRALLHLDAHEIEHARAILERALTLDPDSVHAHNAMSRVLAAAGDDKGAQQHEARATDLQAALSAEEQRLMRRAAQNSHLNETWARGDFEGCQRLVLRFLVEADAAQAEELLGFLEKMYLAAGRAQEAATAVEEARSLLATPATR